ncbi:MAG TPA: cupin domain-containing protein [Thermoanaerobaculia bacterium]|jgi:quercetin dioxygenase-like cupin family protein|nr:cupin domain-containing protein [Thermoanaerobaculia bacterium]
MSDEETGGSKVVRGLDFRWEGIPERRYKEEDGTFQGVLRQTLLGEGEGEAPLAFLTRYFEIEPGGFSTLERHGHPHAVVILRGSGHVVLGGETHPLVPHDCVYVAPETPHQFRADLGEPLGFLCIVDRDRDRPRPIRN